MKLRAYLVDDEPLALRRIARLVEETGRVEIIGQTIDPLEAVKVLPGPQLRCHFYGHRNARPLGLPDA